jgi:hypothetical protein
VNRQQEELLVVATFVGLVAQAQPEIQEMLLAAGEPATAQHTTPVALVLAFDKLQGLLARLGYAEADQDRLLLACQDHWNHMEVASHQATTEAIGE